MKLIEQAQKDIDKAVQAIVDQGGQCLNEMDGCVYYHKGKSCVIGQMCSDPEAIQELIQEGITGSENVLGLLDSSIFCAYLPEWMQEKRYMAEYRSLLIELQEFHDEDKKGRRNDALIEMEYLGLDTSAPQYKQWIEMGVE